MNLLTVLARRDRKRQHQTLVTQRSDLELLPARLSTLNLSQLPEGAELDVATLKELPCLPSLRELSLGARALDPRGIGAVLERCRDLEWLSISEAWGAAPLAALRLKSLELDFREPVKDLARLLPPTLTELVLGPVSAELRHDELISALSSLKSLARLTLKAAHLTPAVARALAASPALTALEVVGLDEPSAGEVYAALAASKTLARLTVDRPLSAAEAKGLARCDALERVLLRIGSTDDLDAAKALADKACVVTFSDPGAATDAMLSALVKALPRTVALSLDPGSSSSLGQKFGAKGLAAVAKLKALEALDLNKNWKLPTEALKALDGHEGLKSLRLSGCKTLTSAAFGVLGSLPALTQLDLRDCIPGAAPLKKLAALPLERLSLGGASKDPKIEDKGLVNLSGSKTLKALSADFDGVTEAGLAALAKLPLEELHVSLKTAPPEGAEALGRMRALRRLSLASREALEDDWLRAAATLPALEVLSVSRTHTYQLTEAGYRALGANTRLHTVAIDVELTPEVQKQVAADCGFFLTKTNPPSFPEACPPVGWD